MGRDLSSETPQQTRTSCKVSALIHSSRGEWQPHGDLNDPSTVRFEWVRLPAEPKKFRGPLPRRWVAKRTIGWLSQSRRMSKDYERLCETSQTMIHAEMSRLMLRRLARA